VEFIQYSSKTCFGKGPAKDDAVTITHVADPIRIEGAMKLMARDYKLCCKGFLKQYRMHGFLGLRASHPCNNTEIIRNRYIGIDYQVASE
jgi:hypothetical protein